MEKPKTVLAMCVDAKFIPNRKGKEKQPKKSNQCNAMHCNEGKAHHSHILNLPCGES